MTISVLMTVCILACEEFMDIEHWSKSSVKYIYAHLKSEVHTPVGYGFQTAIWTGILQSMRSFTAVC